MLVPTRAGQALRRVGGVKRIDPALARRFLELRRERRSLSQNHATVPKKTHAFWAIFPNGDTGIEAEQVIWPSLVVSKTTTVIYAPTTYPAHDACIESTTAYEPKPYGLQIWAWNWCASNPNGGVGAAKKVDAAFLRDYTRASGAARQYNVRIEQTDASTNQWTDYLYNFTTASWDVFFVSEGAADTDESSGWDAYETYSQIDPKTRTSYMCADVQTVGPIVSKLLRLRSNGVWKLADTSDSVVALENNFYCPLDFSVPHPNFEYSVSYR
jgi:hypothetical protein